MAARVTKRKRSLQASMEDIPRVTKKALSSDDMGTLAVLTEAALNSSAQKGAISENANARLTFRDQMSLTVRGPGERQKGPRHWSKEEDERLKQAVEKYGAKQWKAIAEFVPGRTHTQCLQRWNKVLKPGLKKGPWKKDEDKNLCYLVSEQSARASQCFSGTDLAGVVDWSYIASKIPGRSIKQCRERWSYNLSPSVKKGSWTRLEDEVLMRTQKEVGNRWAKIARLLPGRTEHTVKTRFRSIMRARRREWKPEEDMLILGLHSKFGSQWAEIAEQLPGRSKNAVNTRFKVLVKKPAEVRKEIELAARGSTVGTAQTSIPAKQSMLNRGNGQVKMDFAPPQTFVHTAPALHPNPNPNPVTLKAINPLLFTSSGIPQVIPQNPFSVNFMLQHPALVNYPLVRMN